MVVEPGARLERATVRGPAVIGAGAVLRDAYIGPYTAVGAGCVIENAEVEHSILLEGSSVRGLEGRMESSLLGQERRDLARRPPAARLPLHGRRQLGDRDPLARPRRAVRTRDASAAITRPSDEQPERERQRVSSATRR